MTKLPAFGPVLTMASVVGVVLIFRSGVTPAEAQGYCCSSSLVICSVSGCGDDSHSFTTLHKWKILRPGVLGLDGTKFQVRWNATDFVFELFLDDRKLNEKSSDLDALESIGAGRAKDLQAAGVPLE